ncbi:MAG: glycosyltransferase, partial [Pseudomonadota bacterium]
DNAIPAGLIQLKPIQSRARYALSALKITLTRRPKIIFSGHLYHGPLAARLAKLTGARLISQLHGTEIWGPIAPHHLSPLDQSDLVLCVSKDTQARYRAATSQQTDTTLVVPNTVGESFTPGDRDQARQRFNLDGEFAILTVGRLDARQGGYKGHEKIIRALPSLSIDGRDVVYLIAGKGDDKDRLVALVEELGLSEQVRFLGKVPAGDLPDLYRAADLFALPSTGEGFGIVYLEAMASGTPAIGLDVGGAIDALQGLGTLTNIENFPTKLVQAAAAATAMTYADRLALAAETRRRFGHAAFRAKINEALTRLDNRQPGSKAA